MIFMNYIYVTEVHTLWGGTGTLDYRQTHTMLAIISPMVFATNGLRSMLCSIPGSREKVVVHLGHRQTTKVVITQSPPKGSERSLIDKTSNTECLGYAST